MKQPTPAGLSEALRHGSVLLLLEVAVRRQVVRWHADRTLMPRWTHGSRNFPALLGLGEALDDDNVGQLGELMGVEQQLAGAITATHNHPGLLHDRTVDVDG